MQLFRRWEKECEVRGDSFHSVYKTGKNPSYKLLLLVEENMLILLKIFFISDRIKFQR